MGSGLQGNTAWFQDCYGPHGTAPAGRIAIFATPTRGYVIYFHVANQRRLQTTYLAEEGRWEGHWFSRVLATVVLRPDDAFNANPSESP